MLRVTESGLGSAEKIGHAINSFGLAGQTFWLRTLGKHAWVGRSFSRLFAARYVARIVSHPIQRRVDETLGRFRRNRRFLRNHGPASSHRWQALSAPNSAA